MKDKTTMSPEAERLRTGSTLRILGAGVIIFGVWAVVKPALITVAAPTLSGGYNLPPENRTAVGVIGLVVWAAVVILVRLYVGLSAWKEGSGIPQGWGYVIWAVLILLSGFLLFAVLLFLFLHFDVFVEAKTKVTPATLMADFTSDAFASLLVDITSNVILLELIYNAGKMKRLNRRKGG